MHTPNSEWKKRHAIHSANRNGSNKLYIHNQPFVLPSCSISRTSISAPSLPSYAVMIKTLSGPTARFEEWHMCRSIVPPRPPLPRKLPWAEPRRSAAHLKWGASFCCCCVFMLSVLIKPTKRERRRPLRARALEISLR